MATLGPLLLILIYIRPSALDFNHPCESLFKYFCGLHARKIRLDLYSIDGPHALDLHRVYTVIDNHVMELKSKLGSYVSDTGWLSTALCLDFR